MGQGLYTMLGYGVLNPPWADDDETNDDVTTAMMDLGLQTSSECAPTYVVIPLAVDDAWLQEHWKLPPFPDMLPHPQSRTARVLPLDTVPGEVACFIAFQPSAVLLEQWEQARALYHKAGLVLGDPALIVLNDWD
jgi:hypothetical protein